MKPEELAGRSREEIARALGARVAQLYSFAVFAVYDFPRLVSQNRKRSVAKATPSSDTVVRETIEFIEIVSTTAAALTKGAFASLISIEGMDFVRSTQDIDILVGRGIRIFAPSYGEDNLLAESTGLTNFGRATVKELLRSGMILDIAHAPLQVRRELLALGEDSGMKGRVIYSHGGIASETRRKFFPTPSRRSLTSIELRLLKEQSGLVGLTAARPFWSSTESLQRWIDIHLEQNTPIALGLDFGGIPSALLLQSSVTATLVPHLNTETLVDLNRNMARWREVISQ